MPFITKKHKRNFKQALKAKSVHHPLLGLRVNALWASDILGGSSMSHKMIYSILVTIGFLYSFYFMSVNPCLAADQQAPAQSSSTLTNNKTVNPAFQFDADRIAAAETRMWKAYYNRNIQELGLEMIDVLQEQFHLSGSDAIAVAADLSSASLAFQSTKDEYPTQALLGLKSAYMRLKSLTNGTWDAEAAARAELEWWVKRRTPGHNSPEEVGRSIANLYKVLYGKSNKDIERAGLLRARAANIRDTRSDWTKVQNLLQESYRALIRGIQ
jgi:hypothetical protein